ncbi:MAG: hypothetical protein JO207_08590 [Verrucomicrobia bacterium]|nr:hypothetical protein [Verrucomicrobiota bacterium]
MSRAKRFASALASGYLALAANAIYTVLSIPLALHYLTREEFGLWAVVGQVTGYFALLDFGVGASVARILIDYKDNVNGGEYGATLKTASLFFVFQAVVIFFAGLFGGQLLAGLLQVPQHLHLAFQKLMFLQCCVAALSFLTTPFWLPLWSHQRSDLVNLTYVANFVVNGVVLWIGLQAGLRYYSLVLANLFGALVYIGSTTSASFRFGLIPSSGHWGKISVAKFREIFGFSRDVFVLQIANQFISASQIILVSRLIGLDAAAVWSVCTKSFTLAQQIVFKIYDFANAGFSEMVVRRELARFRDRLAQITSITAVAAGLFAVMGACGNRELVYFWTSGKVTWAWEVDVAAAAYLFCTCVSRCYAGITGIFKQIGMFKYVSLLEGLLVVSGSLLLAPHLHFLGVFLAAIIANVLCSGIYGINFVAARFATSASTVTLGWITGAIRFIVFFSVLAALIFWVGLRFYNFPSFALTAALAGVVGSWLGFQVGLGKNTRAELLAAGKKLVPKWETLHSQHS